MSEKDIIHAHALLGVFDHTPVKVRQKIMKDLERSASDAKDEEIERLLRDVRLAFPLVFGGSQE